MISLNATICIFFFQSANESCDKENDIGSKPDEVVVIGTETVVEFIAIVSKIVEKHKSFDKLCFALTLITKYILSVRKV